MNNSEKVRLANAELGLSSWSHTRLDSTLWSDFAVWVVSWKWCPRPCGATPMTYGRSIYAALDEYHINRRVWHELAADRSAWRETLRLGHPPGFVAPPPTPPLALTRPTRRAAIAATCGIDASLRALRAPLV